MIDQVPMEERDTKGDLYEYMLAKIATAGRMVSPHAATHHPADGRDGCAETTDMLCDPACGTGGFLLPRANICANAIRDISRRLTLAPLSPQFFHGFDFDNTMLRIGSMNMLLHAWRIRHPLSRLAGADHAGERRNTRSSLPIRRLPGSLDYENTPKTSSKSLRREDRTSLPRSLPAPAQPRRTAPPSSCRRRALWLSNAHKTLRKILVEIRNSMPFISWPGGVFKPYVGLYRDPRFHQDQLRRTDHVWFYDVDADGMSHRRQTHGTLPAGKKLGPVPRLRSQLLNTQRTSARHPRRAGALRSPPSNRRLLAAEGRWPTTAANSPANAPEQSFLISKADIAAQDYEPFAQRYKEIVHEEVEHRCQVKSSQPRQTRGRFSRA